MAAVSSGGIGDLEGFAGAAEKQMDDVNDLVSRSRHLVSAALPVPCAFSSASGPPLAAPLAVLAGGTTTRDPRPPAGPKAPTFLSFARFVVLLEQSTTSCSSYAVVWGRRVE